MRLFSSYVVLVLTALGYLVRSRPASSTAAAGWDGAAGGGGDVYSAHHDGGCGAAGAGAVRVGESAASGRQTVGRGGKQGCPTAGGSCLHDSTIKPNNGKNNEKM
jgi:hypothetical protein